MQRTPRPSAPVPAAGRLLALGLLAALAPGCGTKEAASPRPVSTPPSVQLVQPQARTIVRTVGQPSFVEAYERTSIYPKMDAYIADWVADIGDRVKKDDVLATLFVPELVEEYATKDATVKLDEQQVRLAEQVVAVAAADVKAAEAGLAEAEQILGKYEAEVERWDTEVKRLQREVDRGVVDPQILLESTNQLKSSTAARDAAKAGIEKAKAELLAAQETLEKDKVAVAVAQADLAVATSEWKRVGAMVGYLTLRAPFDGVIYERNANTFDFVLPATGDPTANRRAPDVSSAGAAPIYVVDRTDIIRVFVDVPERDANFVRGVEIRLMPAPKDLGDLPTEGRNLVVLARMDGRIHVRCFGPDGAQLADADEGQLQDKGKPLDELKAMLDDQWDLLGLPPGIPDSAGVWDKIPGSSRQISPILSAGVLDSLASLLGRDRVPAGSRARVLIQAYRDEPIEGTVTRTSWALNVTSRTLRAEVDLPNPGGQILPGMYAYADVMIEHDGVRALPESALSRVGDTTYCWLYKDGKAARAEVRIGVGDGQWVEVTALRTPGDGGPDLIASWAPVTGSEQVISGDLTTLVDGAPVTVAPPAAPPRVSTGPPAAGDVVK